MPDKVGITATSDLHMRQTIHGHWGCGLIRASHGRGGSWGAVIRYRWLWLCLVNSLWTRSIIIPLLNNFIFPLCWWHELRLVVNRSGLLLKLWKIRWRRSTRLPTTGNKSSENPLSFGTRRAWIEKFLEIVCAENIGEKGTRCWLVTHQSGVHLLLLLWLLVILKMKMILEIWTHEVYAVLSFKMLEIWREQKAHIFCRCLGTTMHSFFLLFVLKIPGSLSAALSHQ